MEENDDAEHILPDLSILLGLSIDRWINFFVFVSAMSSLIYNVLLGHGFLAPTMARTRGVGQEDCRPRNRLLVIVGSLLGFSLVMLRLKFERRLRTNGDRERGLAWDPINWLIGFFFYGIGVEVATLLWTAFVARETQRRLPMRNLSGSDNHRSNAKPSSLNHLVRFSWFLLSLGSGCLLNFFVNRRNHNYEYYGPMRLTRLPSLHNMNKVYPHDDQMHILPNLGCHLDDSIRKNGLEQPYIQATLEIGWGRQWGCRNQPDDEERWNTNWPAVPQCTSFLCSPEDTEIVPGHACPCYNSEEEARNATWTCLNNEFNLKRLQANETFDQEQPPWDDPTWPSLWGYGNCNRNVGTSMDTIYVHKVRFNGQRQQSFGLVCLAFWSFIVIKMVRQI